MRRAKGNLSIPRVSNSQASLCLAFIAAGILFFSLGRFSAQISKSGTTDLAAWGASKDSDTLVVYAYANRDWEYPRNLAFFVQHGACAALFGPGCFFQLTLLRGDARAES